MGRFEAGRFNGFVKKGLVKGIYNDFRNCLMHNERDVHAAAYGNMRKFLKVNNRDERLFVQCEPMLKGRSNRRTKPDVVIFNNRDQPVYVVEFKVFRKPERINIHALVDDLEKLKMLVKKHELSYGFLVVVYDSELGLLMTDSCLRKQGYERISVVEINMRLDIKTGRQRRNYPEWRERFDATWNGQRNQAA